MRAMVLERVGEPLWQREIRDPTPGPGRVLIEVSACGVCRTDLHIVDGELEEPKLPLIPGHEIVGRVREVGEGVEGLVVGDRIGVPWLGHVCGSCGYCSDGRENLCDDALFTGYQLDGGYAELKTADPSFCFPIPEDWTDLEAAPLLCAGLIGYRSYRMTGEARRLGLYGFGAAAHIVAQVAASQEREVYAFTRPGDEAGQAFARRLGAVWVGDSDTQPPEPLEAAILFAPAGELLPRALQAVAKGGIVVCAGIHMSEIPAFPYRILWGERIVRSVANLTRRDGLDFFPAAVAAGVRTEVEGLPLGEANEALRRLREGEVEGALVLTP